MITSKTKVDGTITQEDVPENTLFRALSKITKSRDRFDEDMRRQYPGYVGYAKDIGKVKNGIKTGESAITIFVKKKLPKTSIKTQDLIPEYINNVKTDIMEIQEVVGPRPLPPKKASGQKLGKSKIQLSPIDYQKKYRPMPNGVSIGNIKITAGTFGGPVLLNGVKMPTTNTHVACEDIRADLSAQERDCAQPGPYDDMNTTANKIGYVRKAIIMPEGQVAYNDFAIIECDNQSNVKGTGLGSLRAPKGMTTVAIGDRVWKEGRTTGLTFGNIISTSATISVNYGGEGSVTHVACLLTTDMSDGGDSGSWMYKKVSPGDTITDEDMYVWGYLFAGSSTNTVCHEIQNALSALGAVLYTEDNPEPPNDDVEINIVMEEESGGSTFRVFGTVNTANGGNSLSGVVIDILGSSGGVQVVIKNGVSGSDGSFNITECPKGYTYMATFTKNGFTKVEYVIGPK